MKNRRAVGLLNLMRDKNWRQEPGGRRDDTCDRGLSRSWKVDVCENKKKIDGLLYASSILFYVLAYFILYQVTRYEVSQYESVQVNGRVRRR